MLGIQTWGCRMVGADENHGAMAATPQAIFLLTILVLQGL